MIALVTGGAASGKSAYAEELACSLSPQRTYLATMRNNSAESAARVERHRAQREAAGFSTLECVGTLSNAAPDPVAAEGVVLVDDVGNLVSCALFSEDGTMADPQAVLARLDAEFATLCTQYAHVVVVGNQVGADGQSFADESGTWVRMVGALCCCMAARCDAVVEVVAGCPVYVKGGAEGACA